MQVVRTTFQPDKEIEVDAAEYADLKAQGLLVEDETPASGNGEQDESAQDKQPEQKQKPDTGKAGTEK